MILENKLGWGPPPKISPILVDVATGTVLQLMFSQSFFIIIFLFNIRRLGLWLGISLFIKKKKKPKCLKWEIIVKLNKWACACEDETKIYSG